MDNWECPCGYVYSEEEGDYERRVDQGTRFSDLPEDWCCPLCGAEQKYFEKQD